MPDRRKLSLCELEVATLRYEIEALISFLERLLVRAGFDKDEGDEFRPRDLRPSQATFHQGGQQVRSGYR